MSDRPRDEWNDSPRVTATGARFRVWAPKARSVEAAIERETPIALSRAVGEIDSFRDRAKLPARLARDLVESDARLHALAPSRSRLGAVVR